MSRLAILGVALGAWAIPLHVAQAESTEAFYKSTPVTMVIGYPSGAVYDVYARTVGRHFGSHLPGTPNVIAQNMPGAGSLKAANYLYNNAPKNGSTFGTFSRGIPMQPLIEKTGIHFDALKFNWLGSPSSEVSVVFSWHDTPFKTIQDVFKQEMIVSATGSGADSAIFPYVMNSTLKTKFRVITGYAGASGTLLAIERGEVHGSAGTSWTNLTAVKPEWLREHKVNVLLQLSAESHQDLPKVPLVMDLAKNDTDRQVLDLIFSRQTMAYPFAAPPDLPKDRVAALQNAFTAVLDDPAFRADAKRQNLDIKPVSGKALTDLLKRVYSSPSTVVEKVRTAIAEGQKMARKKH